MNRLIQFSLVVLVVSGCDMYMIEPAYDSRDRLIGQYEVEEYSETYKEWIYYSIHVTKATSRERIYIDNFYGSNMRVYAFVDYGRITIPYQVVKGYEIEGIGSFQDYCLGLHYSVRDIHGNSYTDFCEAEARRY